MAAPEGIEELVVAIVTGDLDRIDALLGQDPALATAKLPDNPRSMLHHATDWPGHWPNVAATIRRLVAAGADPNAGAPHPDDERVAETPLHWAASSNDVDAVNALLDVGADVDAPGGIFGGCTPFEEAVIFEQYDAARALLARGATNYLPGAAALGLNESIDDFFDDNGSVRTDVGVLPHWENLPPRQTVLDRAFQFACRAGHIEIARILLDRGADVTSTTPPGTTALDEARANGHADVVAWLTDLTATDRDTDAGR